MNKSVVIDVTFFFHNRNGSNTIHLKIIEFLLRSLKLLLGENNQLNLKFTDLQILQF